MQFEFTRKIYFEQLTRADFFRNVIAEAAMCFRHPTEAEAVCVLEWIKALYPLIL